MRNTDKEMLIRHVRNYESLDAIRTHLAKLNFIRQNDGNAVEAITGMVGKLITSTMDAADQITVIKEKLSRAAI